MRNWVACLLLLPAVAWADDWQTLAGSEIKAQLTGRMVVYADARQFFAPDGSTLYVAGETSAGRWRVDGDRYCSLWPPAEEWVCYGVAANGGSLRFTSPGGDVTEGKIVN